MYSPLSGITHDGLMNIPIICKITKGSMIEYDCMYLFQTSIDIMVQLIGIPNYFKVELILEQEGIFGMKNNIIHTQDLEKTIESITLNDIVIYGGWTNRTYNLYMRIYGLNNLRLIKKFYLNPTSTVTFPSKSYLMSISNALSNSDINIWKRAISLHIPDGTLNKSAIHTLMVFYALNFKGNTSSSSDVDIILLLIMEILGKRITKEILYITVKRIVDFKYHSDTLINDLIIEMEDYINSNVYKHDKFMKLIQHVRDIRI